MESHKGLDWRRHPFCPCTRAPFWNGVLSSLERLEHLAEKFRRKCALHEEWSHGKEDALCSQDWKSCGLYKIKVRRRTLWEIWCAFVCDQMNCSAPENFRCAQL